MLWTEAAYEGLGAGEGARVSDVGVQGYQRRVSEMVKSEQKPERD